MNSKLVLSFLSCLMLLGCSNDNSSEGSAAAGTYDAVYQDENNIVYQVQLALSEASATIRVMDANDRTEVLGATRTDNTLTFSEDIACDITETSAVCRINNMEGIALDPSVDPEQEGLSGLEGSYLKQFNDGVINIEVDAEGTFTAVLDDCSIEGSIFVVNQAIQIQETAHLCMGSAGLGMVSSDHLFASNDTLTVSLPDSPLSGFWFSQQ